jgi:hypothetical protein
MEIALLAFAVAGGYVAAIFTWDRLHTFFIGAQAKAQALRLKALAIESTVKTW